MSDIVRTSEKLSGLERIRLERERQITGEKFDAARDDQYTRGELARAAVCYELAAINCDESTEAPRGWPWPKESWKPHGTLRCLEKAGGLFLAEIDRLMRKGADKSILSHYAERVTIIAEEIDKFLAPLPGDASLMKYVDKAGNEQRSLFGLIADMNLDGGNQVRMLNPAKARPAIPLYYEEHLRRKLAVSLSDPSFNGAYGPDPSGSVMNVGEVCAHDTGIMCSCRLEWLMSFLKRANYNICMRLFEADATIMQQQVTIESLKQQLSEIHGEPADGDL